GLMDSYSSKVQPLAPVRPGSPSTEPPSLTLTAQKRKSLCYLMQNPRRDFSGSSCPLHLEARRRFKPPVKRSLYQTKAVIMALIDAFLIAAPLDAQRAISVYAPSDAGTLA